MRGQVSLEFMVVLAVFLAALGVWLAGVGNASHAIDAALGAKQAELAAERLASTINAVCVMGDGNSLDVEVIIPGEAELTEGMSLHWNNKTFKKLVYCGSEGLTLSGRQKLTVTNDNGFIRIA
ncbi:MAG: hypothetical protein KAW41_06610 [Candidatus Diapherotrites archaeon]|nr:hypothetical protein [Candidatus Diapherotrites archaeon]